MIIKHNDLKQRYDIVIIGGGIAGLALSRFLNLENRKILIVEAGKFQFDREINNKSFATSKELGNWPSKNYSSFYSRVRMFGGNANVWGGWCMELDEYDYKNNEIWNSLKDDLNKHYLQAYKLLNINTKSIENLKLNLRTVDPYMINVSRGNFINECRNYVIENKNIDLLLNSELVKINLENDLINSIIIQDHDGVESIVNLSKLIVSTGGIETTKIILKNLPKNKHNKNSGKFFMEHPQIQVGRVKIKNSEINKFIPVLKKQIEIIEPKMIVGLGKVVGRSLINENLSMDILRNKVHSFSSCPLKITYSPDILLQYQSLKKLAWEDFQFIRDFVK